MSGSDSGSFRASLKIDPDPGVNLALRGLELTEELGRPFHATVLMLATTQSGKTFKTDLTSSLGGSATLSVKLADDSTQYFNGVITRLGYVGIIGGGYHFQMELRPWIWLLSRTQDCRIFQNMAPWDIIMKVFRDQGFSDLSDKRQNQAGSQTLEYCVQYNETALDFVTRLMETYGIYYYFTHSDGQHVLELADDPNSHTVLPAALPYNFDRRDARAMQDQVWAIGADQHLDSGAYTYRDYNFTTPAADLTAKSIQSPGHQHGSLEVYAYPGPYADADHGQKLSSIRMQAITARRKILHGTTNSRKLYAGCKFTMAKFPDDAANQEYLVTSTTRLIRAAETISTTAGEIADTYECSFTAIPGTIPFQLEVKTPRPITRGPQTALVVGESGDEITTDQYGRIKVQFYWDRVGQKNENSSCWIRVAQPWAGSGWGGIVIPRIGQEVVVDFLHGNPDYPMVVGCVYNANNTVPYALPDNKTRSTMKSNSSQGGGGFNELRLEDKKGSEEVFLQAQYDFNINVLHNRGATIKQDDSTTVSQGNRAVTVSQGNDGLTVSQGNHSIAVSAGSSTLDVGQSITLNANTSITLTVGASSLTLSPSGITMSAPQIQLSAQASLTANGGAEMTLQAGMISIN